MGVRAFYGNDEKSVKEYGEALKFWSNAIGELHNPSAGDTDREGLPEQLKRVYDDLYWEPCSGASLRYFAETERGYGIALLNEYDTVTAETSGIAFEPLFQTVIADAVEIAKDPLFKNYDVFVADSLGFDGCHEMVVVLPWNISVEDFKRAAERLDEFVYVACGINRSLTDKGLGTWDQGPGRELLSSSEFNNDSNSMGSLSLEEKLGQAKVESVRFMTDSVVGVGDFAEDDKVRTAVNDSFVLRNKVLDTCYKIPNYAKLPLEDKNALYELVLKAVSLDFDKDITM